MKIYIDGSYYNKEEARISVFDHGLLYGDGIFEGIRIYNGRIFKLSEHIHRLYEGARAIMLDIPMTLDEMEDTVKETVKLNELEDGYIRLIVTRGRGNLGLNPFQCPRATVIVIADTIELYPKEYYEKGISVITSSLRRIQADSLDPRIKSLNYLNNIMARMEAIQAGCLEAVMLNHEGFVAECTGDNIFIIKGDVLITPEVTQGALDGITRSFILQLAEDLEVTTKECRLTQFDLYTADECFLTGTAAEVIGVTQIDGRTIGTGKPGEMTLKLMDAFREEVRSGHSADV